MRRATLRLVALALALAIGVVAATAFPAAASAKAKPTCKRFKAKTVVQNRVARVFTQPFGYGSRDILDLIGCWKSTGRAFSVTAPGDGCITRGTFKIVRLRGRFVAAYIDARTRADCVAPIDPVRRFVNVVNVRSGASSSYEIPARPAGDRLLLNTKGMVVWPSWLPQNQVEVLVPYGVELPWQAGNGPGGIQTNVVYTVGSRAIHPESVHLSPSGRVTWINDGVPGAFQIGHDPYPPS